KKFGSAKVIWLPCLLTSLRLTIFSACGYGKGRNSTASTMLKIAVFAPMPNASVSTATAVKPGFFSNWRKAKRRSLNIARRAHQSFASRWMAPGRYGFQLVRAQLAIWLKRAHVIESKLLCITCAIDQTKGELFTTSGERKT